MEWGARQDFVV